MDEKISKVKLSLSGLSCASCVLSIENTLKKLPGLVPSSINVNLLTSNAILEFNENVINIEQIKQAVIDTGYNVEDVKVEKKYNTLPSIPQKAIVKKDDHNIDIDISSQEGGSSVRETITKLIISGMTCASCINTIQYALESLPGVEYAHVNLLTNEATIKHDLNKVGPRDLIKTVEDSGYGAELFKKDNNGNPIRIRAEKHQKLLRTRFFISLFFAIPTALISMVFMMILPNNNPVNMTLSYQIVPGLEVGTMILFILSTPVQFLLGYPFYTKGIRSIWYTHQANMDTLVAIGTTVAYFGSILSIIPPIVNKSDKSGYQFFETSVFLITFIWLGRWMEAKVKGKTFEIITKLMELQPEKATLITLGYDDNKQGSEKEIDIDLIQGKYSKKKITLKKKKFSLPIVSLPILFFLKIVDDILKVNPGARIPCDG
jgi:P-type Cu+ transporter